MEVYVWLGIVILLTVLELLTHDLKAIWFMISGCISLVYSLHTDDFLMEFFLFVICGILLYLFVRPHALKTLHKKEEKDESLIGLEGIVVKTITKKKIGEVRIKKHIWNAKANEKIKVGCMIQVVNQTEHYLEVKEIKE